MVVWLWCGVRGGWPKPSYTTQRPGATIQNEVHRHTRTREVVPVREEHGLDGVQLHVELRGARDGGRAGEADGAGGFLLRFVGGLGIVK